MRRLLVSLLALTAIGCGVTAPLASPAQRAGRSPTYAGLGLENLEAYHATFEMRFEGDFEWVYHLEIRADGRAVEYRLHLEGLSAARNPGDVRLVTEGGISRMRGPGTDDECLQFPSDLDLGLGFLTPDDVIAPRGLDEPLVVVDSETIAGVATIHYTLNQANLDDWRDLELNLWLDEDTDAVLRYELRAAGPDPLFDAGEGLLSGLFLVVEVGPQAIEPVTGCEIDLPLPPDAVNLVRLPGGLFSFDTSADATDIVAFYQAELAEEGWEPLDEPQIGVDAVVLSYRCDEETLEINIETVDEGAHVDVLPGQE